MLYIQYEPNVWFSKLWSTCLKRTVSMEHLLHIVSVQCASSEMAPRHVCWSWSAHTYDNIYKGRWRCRRPNVYLPGVCARATSVCRRRNWHGDMHQLDNMWPPWHLRGEWAFTLSIEFANQAQYGMSKRVSRRHMAFCVSLSDVWRRIPLGVCCV